MQYLHLRVTSQLMFLKSIDWFPFWGKIGQQCVKIEDVN